jgi:carbamate kinase
LDVEVADQLVAASGRRPRLLIALGGNAISVRSQPLDAAPQVINVHRAVAALAPLAATHDLVITHGNGPQVGLLALESAADTALARPYPLDALGAETQGLIGYWLAQAMLNAVPGREVVALVTQTLVVGDDPAFSEPTKFIGPTYNEDQARTLATARGWTVRADGAYWRRVVPSPAPQSIIEIEVIERLVNSGVIVICAGGGGVPVIRDAAGDVVGVEAVIDKDLSSALIAELIQADALLLLTDVAAVSPDINDPAAAAITRSTPNDLRSRQFPAGSMGPKVEAACRFVERGGGMAAIGALADVASILEGVAGTIVTSTGVYPEISSSS